jgi:hypothetical protein
MSIEVAAELWSELKRYVNTVDRDDAAESVVALLIDNDYEADEIRDAFKGDSDIKRALAAYTSNDDTEEEIDDEDEYYDADWED